MPRHGAARVACVRNDAQAARCFDDMTQFLGQGVYLLPGREVALYHVSAASRELTFRRAETLWAAASGRARAVVTSVAALQHRLMPVESFRPFALSLSVGQRADMAQVAAALAGAGYERVERVDARGQFALRGGILDVFPPTGTDALRVEWFDDEVDSIRTLEVSTQRSTGNLRACELPPAAELLPGDRAQAAWAAESLSRALENALRRNGPARAPAHEGAEDAEDALPGLDALPDLDAWPDLDAQGGPGAADGPDTLPSLDALGGKARLNLRPGTPEDKLASRVGRCIEALREGAGFSNMEAYVPLLYPQTQTLADWLESPVVLLDEPDKLRDVCQARLAEFAESFKGALERGEAMPAQSELLLDDTALLSALTARGAVLLSTFLRTMGGLHPTEILRLEGTGATAYHNQFRELAADITTWREGGWRIALLSGGAARGARLRDHLEELGVRARLEEGEMDDLPPGQAVILPLSLSHGFLYPEIRLAVVADADMYGAAYRKRRTRRNAGERIAAFTDLAVGDYVVHESHGVGVYRGTVRLQSEGLWRDYLFIQYQGNDKLYVPTDQMDRVQRYIGSDSAPPRINGWAATKGSGRSKRSSSRCAPWRSTWSGSMPTARRPGGLRSAPTPPGSASLRTISPLRRRPTSSRRLRKSRRTWKRPRSWTASCAATWDTARRRSRSARLSRPSWMANSAPFSRLPPSWRSSTFIPSSSASRAFPCARR